MRALPMWPYSQTWGSDPSGVAGLIILVIVIMPMTERLSASLIYLPVQSM